MSFKVETGLLIAGANSYCTVSEADTYFEDRGNTGWAAASDDAKEQALVRGADYLRQKYRMSWKGSLVNPTQAMDWPRTGVDRVDYFDPFYKNHFVPYAFENSAFIPVTEIPVELKQAQMLLARATMSDAGVITTVLQPSIGRVTSSEQVGSLAVTYEPGSAGQRMTQIYWDADQMLKVLLLPGRYTQGSLVRG